eukprot:scaffold1661_cov251-Pinguiococcus_pyrenoidosus.AAC.49
MLDSAFARDRDVRDLDGVAADRQRRTETEMRTRGQKRLWTEVLPDIASEAKKEDRKKQQDVKKQKQKQKQNQHQNGRPRSAGALRVPGIGQRRSWTEPPRKFNLVLSGAAPPLDSAALRGSCGFAALRARIFSSAETRTAAGYQAIPWRKQRSGEKSSRSARSPATCRATTRRPSRA